MRAESKQLEHVSSFHAFVPRHGSQDGAQCADPECFVIRDDNALVRRLLSLQDKMAALLMDNLIAPMSAEQTDQLLPAEVPWQLHPYVKTSSRTRWRRIAEGFLG